MISYDICFSLSGLLDLILLEERGPLPGPKCGLFPTLGNESSGETHVLRKQETLLGRGALVESRE